MMTTTMHAANLPQDRGAITTEARSARAPLDTMPTGDVVSAVATEQARAAGLVADHRDQIGRIADAVAGRMSLGGRLIYLGAGTSGRLGVLDASECPPTFGVSPDLVLGLIAGGDRALRRSSEHVEDRLDGAHADMDKAGVCAADVVVGIAAGGTTPWVLGGLDHARGQGAMTVLLTCARRDKPPYCDELLLLDTGAEVVAGSTRLAAGTATKVALNALTTAVFVRRGAVHDDLMINLRATNDKLLDRAIRMLQVFAPTLSRADSADAIRQADGELKTAIVCILCSVDAASARNRLAAVGGHLRKAIS